MYCNVNNFYYGINPKIPKPMESAIKHGIFHHPGKSEPSSCTTPVRTGEDIGGTKPEWLKKLPPHMAAPLGRPFTLECVATGNPVPTGRWLRNGREIVLGTR